MRSLDRVRACYDAVAAEYARVFAGEHDRKPKDREVLERFVRAVGDRGPVWDMGCGPGHTTRYLEGLGLTASGMDISEGMVARARMLYPHLVFRQGDVLALDLPDASVAGVLAFYALVHCTRAQVRTALGEMHRVLRPGGLLLLAFHVGDQSLALKEFLGKAIDVRFRLFPVAFMEGSLAACGFDMVETLERPPYPEGEYPSRRAYVFARKPGG